MYYNYKEIDMPKMKKNIRIIQNDANGRLKLSFPLEVGWQVGDVVLYIKEDEHKVVLKRLHQ